MNNSIYTHDFTEDLADLPIITSISGEVLKIHGQGKMKLLLGEQYVFIRCVLVKNSHVIPTRKLHILGFYIRENKIQD